MTAVSEIRTCPRVLLWSVLAILATGCTAAGPPTATAEGAARARPTAVDRGVHDPPELGPRPPEQGALVGVAPNFEDHTIAGRLAAFRAFEEQVGARMDVAHVFHPWTDDFPDAVDRELVSDGRTLLLSWAGYDTRVIASGGQDHLIRQRARALADWGEPVLLRWRWEMDRPNLRAEVWSGDDYVAAWGHIREIFRQEGASNVGWVWCPHAKGFSDPSRRAQDYYPGDDQVDWLCASVYGEGGLSFEEAAASFLNWSVPVGKPIIIGEFGTLQGDRGRWLEETADLVEQRPQIKGLVYFDYHHRSKGSDHRLSRSPDAVNAFRELVGQVRRPES